MHYWRLYNLYCEELITLYNEEKCQNNTVFYLIDLKCEKDLARIFLLLQK